MLDLMQLMQVSRKIHQIHLNLCQNCQPCYLQCSQIRPLKPAFPRHFDVYQTQPLQNCITDLSCEFSPRQNVLEIRVGKIIIKNKYKFCRLPVIVSLQSQSSLDLSFSCIIILHSLLYLSLFLICSTKNCTQYSRCGLTNVFSFSFYIQAGSVFYQFKSTFFFSLINDHSNLCNIYAQSFSHNIMPFFLSKFILQV